MAGWTTDRMPDQTGRVVIVTGANSGLGLVATLELARHGARVVMACRNENRGRSAYDRIAAQVPADRLELRLLDLADLADVRRFADALPHDRVDVLLNNAGVMAIPFRMTTDGFEMQFGTNHLGHFALTGLLLRRLLAAAEPRVVTVSSGAHRIGRIDIDNLQSERGYRRWQAYGASKLANLLFAYELDRRARARGTELLSAAAHPGYTATNLQVVGAQMRGRPMAARLAGLVNGVVGQSASMGALPELYAATMPDVEGGGFYGPDRLREMRGHPQRVESTPASHDVETASRLWEASERLTGVAYPWPSS